VPPRVENQLEHPLEHHARRKRPGREPGGEIRRLDRDKLGEPLCAADDAERALQQARRCLRIERIVPHRSRSYGRRLELLRQEYPDKRQGAGFLQQPTRSSRWPSVRSGCAAEGR